MRKEWLQDEVVDGSGDRFNLSEDEKSKRQIGFGRHDGSEAKEAETKAVTGTDPEILFESDLEIIGSLSEVFRHVQQSIVLPLPKFY